MEESEELLKQFVQDALLLKSSGGGTTLYDQYVEKTLLPACLPACLPVFSRCVHDDYCVFMFMCVCCCCRLVQELLRLKEICEKKNDVVDVASEKQLVALLKGVSRCLALVKESHHQVLATEILNIRLWNVGAVVREAVLMFICQAVVVNGSFMQSSLHVLVYSLVPPPVGVVVDPNPGNSWSPSVEEMGIQDAIIRATKRVIELVPSAASRLLPLLVSNMPHKMRDRGVHCLYLRGMFAVAEGPHGYGLGDGLIPAVIAHLIDVDVDITWEDIVEVMTEEAREEVKGESPRRFDEPDIFDLEGMSEGEACLGAAHEQRGGWEGCREMEVINPAPSDRAQTDCVVHVDEMADKMDSLMELTLSHLRHRISRGEIQHVWKSLLDAFEGIILQTHRSKFTQFVVFYVSSMSPVYCAKSLLHLLLQKLSDKNQAPIVRSACAAYIGSFLARAAFIPEVTVIETFHKLADWCMKYAREEDRRGGLPPIPSAGILVNTHETVSRHASFYAACQALLYALCYHMEPLWRANGAFTDTMDDAPQGGMDDVAMSFEGDGRNLKDICARSVHRLFRDVMPKLLTHTLDPLSSCAKSVVIEFGRQAKTLGHDEVAGIISDWETRCVVSENGARYSRPLEIFFPFDPYLLRRSATIMDLPRTYVKWRKGHPTATVPDDGEDGRVVGGSSDEDLNSYESDMNSDDDDDDDSSLHLSSSSESDDMKRTRFGSMPDSSVSSGGRKYLSRRLPGALKASILAHGAAGGSPTGGIPILRDSPSTDHGSPWGMSPASAFYPMSHTSNDRFPQ